MNKSKNKKKNRIWRGIILFFIIVILAPGLWVALKIITNPTGVIPYPYKVLSIIYTEREQAENTTVLIVGDRMAKVLENYHPQLIQKSSINLTTPLTVFNWAQEHESLSRTLAKLRSLKKIPKVVIYHGASEEYYEKRFIISDGKTILSNFSKQKDAKLYSLFLAFPLLARLIYSPTKQVILGGEIVQDKKNYTDPEFQLQTLVHYNFFEAEIQDLIFWAKENKTQLIIVNTPINLEAIPHHVCENTTSENLKSYQNEISERISKDDLKTTSSELRELTQKIIGNALNFHMLGTVYLKTGQMAKAKESFTKAAAYDCSPWRASPIHNILLTKYTTQENIPLVNFDKLVNQNFGLDSTFISEIIPQNIYYQQLTEILALQIIKVLHL